MAKRRSYDIQKQILRNAKDGETSYAKLERKINTGYKTIKDNCKYLQDFGHIKVERIGNHPANGRSYYRIKITDRGITFLKENKLK